MKSAAPTAAPLPRAELPHTPPDLTSLWTIVEEATRNAVGAEVPAPLLLTKRQAAALLMISERSLEYLEARGRGPKRIRIGKCVRYRLKDLEEWLEKKATRTPRKSA